MIDNILVVIFVGLAFAANFMLPSKTKIQNNEAPKYKSQKKFISLAGLGAIIGGVLILLLFIFDEQYQEIFNVVKMALLVVIGIALISSNSKKSKFMTECETAGFPMAAPGGEVVAASVAQQPKQAAYAPQTTAQVGQVVTPQVVTAQTAPVQKVPVQQAQEVRAQPTAQAQPRQAAVQPQQVAAQRPRILRIKCPRCKKDMQIDTRMLGQKMKCPHCGIEGKIG